MIDAMCRELHMQRDFFGDTAPLQSVYLGGGTPSLLPAAELELLFDAVYTTFSVAEEAEVTLEANPDDLGEEKIRFIAEATPINRLSLGIQSFQNEILSWMNRAHTGAEAKQVLEALRERDFDLNTDLIYALPAPFTERSFRDAQELLRFQPEHISAYTLTIEERTAFGYWLEKGKIQVLDEDTAARQFVGLSQLLEENGYEHYEISNFARAKKYARHNTAYWLGKPYLGIGPGAHSFRTNKRWANVANNAKYIRAISEGRLPAQEEELSPLDRVNELLLTRLRTLWGCPIEVLEEYIDFESLLGKPVQRLVDKGWMQRTATHLYLTRTGRLFADEVAATLFLTS